ncbi:MAG: VOC family protein [Paracoccaceae bacterium]
MIHFEIFVTDMTAAQIFYGHLFGWSFEKMSGGEDANYHLIISDALAGHMTGGMLARNTQMPKPGSGVRGSCLTIAVAKVDALYDWALSNGGAEALPPTDYPGIGRVAYIEDGQGNIVGMISPTEDGE